MHIAGRHGKQSPSKNVVKKRLCLSLPLSLYIYIHTHISLSLFLCAYFYIRCMIVVLCVPEWTCDAHVIWPFSEISKSVEFTAVSLFWYYYIYIYMISYIIYISNTFYIHFIYCIVYTVLHNVCLVYILNIWFHF